MNDNSLLEIIRQCLSIDSKSLRIYTRLSEIAEGKEIRDFWGHMAEDEKEHILLWQYLSELVEQGVIPQVFDDPAQILEDLKTVGEKADELFEKCNKHPDILSTFLVALRLEFYLLHPDFKTLFNYSKNFTGTRNPEEDYEKHVRELFAAIEKFGKLTPEIEFIGEALRRLWIENKSLAQYGLFDELTGIYNRRGFFHIVKPISHLAQRNDFKIGIMMVDIDHFKKINDTFGHDAGDRVLKQVAATLKKNIRASDIIGRYGGEEFIIFFSLIDAGPISAIAEKLRERVSEDTRKDTHVTISIGLAYGSLQAREEDMDLMKLVKKADMCLYDAKNTGRNRVVMSIID